MIYKSECWSVELPPTWHGKACGSYSIFAADPPIGALMIMRREYIMTLTDHDLKKSAQLMTPDLRLEQIRLGVLSGFTAKYQEDEMSWQVWHLRHGTWMLHIAYNVPCGTEPTEQEPVMAILTSLQIEGVETITEQIDKNEDLKCVLDAHGMESIVHDDWIFPYDKFPAVRCLWLPVVSPQTGVLEVHVLCENDDVIAEAFAGFGADDERYKDAFGSFMANSLHVLLAAFWDKHPERITKEMWKINGWDYTAYIGPFGTRNPEGVEGLIPETAFNEIKNVIKREKLTKPLHWIRTFVGCVDGKFTFEALFNNENWPSGEIVLNKIHWKKLDSFYSVRNFLILKQIGTNKWWQKIKWPR